MIKATTAPTTLHDARVRQYYEKTNIDYEIFLQRNNHLGMHYGFWEWGIFSISQAVINQNKVLANQVGIQRNMRVLDAGCGVGGSAIFLAQHYGCRVDAITIVPSQVTAVKKNAQARNANNLVFPSLQDYTKTTFPNNTFDVVWAVESVCHTPNKKQFLKEAYRILKPGGKLIMADGFLTKAYEDYNKVFKKFLRLWWDGWAVSDLFFTQSFISWSEKVGFHITSMKNENKRTALSSLYFFLLSLGGWIIVWPLLFLRIRTSEFLRQTQACFFQGITRQLHVWKYVVVICEKSK